MSSFFVRYRWILLLWKWNCYNRNWEWQTIWRNNWKKKLDIHELSPNRYYVAYSQDYCRTPFHSKIFKKKNMILIGLHVRFIWLFWTSFSWRCLYENELEELEQLKQRLSDDIQKMPSTMCRNVTKNMLKRSVKKWKIMLQ